jgi:hypothetical protein
MLPQKKRKKCQRQTLCHTTKLSKSSKNIFKLKVRTICSTKSSYLGSEKLLQKKRKKNLNKKRLRRSN